MVLSYPESARARRSSNLIYFCLRFMDLLNQRIVFYDGYCVLCSRLIRFLMKRDKKKIFLYATLDKISDYSFISVNSENAKWMDSIVYARNANLYFYSDAGIKILSDLGGIWKIVSILLHVFPKWIRDLIYKTIAKHRYKIFGKSNECALPDELIDSK